MVGIDARNGKVATRGWLETSEVQATDLAQQMANFGVAAIIYTDIQRDGTMQGPNLESLRELANSIEIPVIASGGVSSTTDLLSLLALEPIGVTGAIVGRALYHGRYFSQGSNSSGWLRSLAGHSAGLRLLCPGLTQSQPKAKAVG